MLFIQYINNVSHLIWVKGNHHKQGQTSLLSKKKTCIRKCVSLHGIKCYVKVRYTDLICISTQSLSYVSFNLSHMQRQSLCVCVFVCVHTRCDRKSPMGGVCVLRVCTVSTESKSVLANTAVLHSTVIWHFEAFSAPQIVHIATARSLWMLQEWLIHLGNSAQIASYHLQEGKHDLRNKTRQ